jgi:hypothetical protein
MYDFEVVGSRIALGTAAQDDLTIHHQDTSPAPSSHRSGHDEQFLLHLGDPIERLRDRIRALLVEIG